MYVDRIGTGYTLTICKYALHALTLASIDLDLITSLLSIWEIHLWESETITGALMLNAMQHRRSDALDYGLRDMYIVCTMYIAHLRLALDHVIVHISMFYEFPQFSLRTAWCLCDGEKQMRQLNLNELSLAAGCLKINVFITQMILRQVISCVLRAETMHQTTYIAFVDVIGGRRYLGRIGIHCLWVQKYLPDWTMMKWQKNNRRVLNSLTSREWKYWWQVGKHSTILIV